MADEYTEKVKDRYKYTIRINIHKIFAKQHPNHTIFNYSPLPQSRSGGQLFTHL